MKSYLVAYDILSDKRAFKVRKLVYSYALSGQKSALELSFEQTGFKRVFETAKTSFK